MYLEGGMPAALSSNEEAAYYGEAASGIPATQQFHHGYADPFAGEIRNRRSFNGRWSASLFDCCDTPYTCLVTFLCPCITFGQIAEIVDRGQTSCMMGAVLYEAMKILTCCPCLYAAYFRAKMRAQYRLPEIPASDWIVHFLCEPCALSQEYTELQRQGWVMTIGWQRNSEIQRRTATMPPAVAPPMFR